MSYTIVISERAKKEMLDACAWYNERLHGLGDKFEHIIFEKLYTIANNPHLIRKRTPTYHEVSIKTFPYLIIYRVEEGTKEVYIASIFHTSQSPKKKYRK